MKHFNINEVQHTNVIGVVFNTENQYLKAGYLATIKNKHPEANVILMDDIQLVSLRDCFSFIYIITDYIYYAAHCVCQDHDRVLHIVDECEGSTSSINKKSINNRAHLWAAGKSTLQSSKCLYCSALADMSLSELNMISTINSFVEVESDIKRKVMDYLDINIKAYSRILRKLLSRLHLKNEYALIQWARYQTHYNYQEVYNYENQCPSQHVFRLCCQYCK